MLYSIEKMSFKLLLFLSCFFTIITVMSCRTAPSPGAGGNSGGSSSSSSYSTNTASISIATNVKSSLNPLFFGHNYWNWPAAYGDAVAGTEPVISPLGIKFLRAGGQNNDGETGVTNGVNVSIPLDQTFMSNYNAYCINIGGAAPMLQLPLASTDSTTGRVARASNLLAYYINTNAFTLSWVDIGNEPDYYYGSYPSLDITNMTNYFDSFTNVAAFVKNKYSSIKIAGPDLSSGYMNPGSDFLTRFLQSCGPYINAVSLHYYPAGADVNATYTFATNQFDATTNFYSTVYRTIKNYGQGQSLMIGECQISWDGNPSDTASEASLGTIGAGLWLADFLGISSAQSNFISVMPWSISESWLTGFLAQYPGNKPRPVYYIYEIFSSHALTNMILCREAASDLRIYAYDDVSGNVSLFCVNWSKTSYYSIDFNFSGGLLLNSSITYTFSPLSLTCLLIPANQTHGTSYSYSSADASAGNGIETNNF